MNSPFVPPQNVFTAAVHWLEGTLLGTLATTVAVLAIASVGFLLFSGRVDVRRAAQVIFGCFILFGASSIATGVTNALQGAGGNDPVEVAPPPSPLLPQAAPEAPLKAVPYDPYAGAAMPVRQ